MVDSYCMEDAEICIFAAGSVARSARQAVRILREKGVKAGMLRPQIVWPFPKMPVEEVFDQVRFILVPEMNVGQLRKEVERLRTNMRVKVKGLNVLNSVMITAEQVVERVLQIDFQARPEADGGGTTND
jgi:2-oxoglutarate ferredoxin oxidoreductase subunit alpha